MKVTKYNLTPDGLIPEESGQPTNNTLTERQKCPEAFLLSSDEAVLVIKAKQLFQDVFEPYKNCQKRTLRPYLILRFLRTLLHKPSVKDCLLKT